MADLLVDTDVFIDHLRGSRRLRPGRRSLSYSVITRAELFAGRSADEDVLHLLLEPFGEWPVERTIGERAGRLRRDLGLRLPDALIAATALEHRLSILTRNVRDFAQVPGLKLVDPG